MNVNGLRKLRMVAVLIAMTGLFCLLGGQPAQASTATNTLSVTATVVNYCTVNTSSLSFGNYQGSDATATATATLTCTNGTAETIGLDAGANGAHAVGTTRAMTDGSSHYLSYEIYQNSGHTTVWDASTHTEAGTGTGSAQSLTAYGDIPANQLTAPAGSYTDTVNINVTY